MFGVHVCRSGFGGIAMDSAVDEELTMLECMYERIKVVEAEGQKGRQITLDLTPRTGGLLARDFVSCQLVLVLDEDYPRESPAFTISMSKGLGDDDLSFLENGIAACAHELWGSAEAEPVAMGCVSLVEAASNCLDELNCKSACQVCLMPLFEEQEQHQCGPPMRTACYHPFHTECLAEWWVRCERSEKPQQSGQDFYTVRKNEMEVVLRSRLAEAERVRSDLVDVEWRINQATASIDGTEAYIMDPLERREVQAEISGLQARRKALRHEQRVGATRVYRAQRDAEDAAKALAKSQEAAAAKPRTIPCPVCRALLDLAELTPELAAAIEEREKASGSRAASPAVEVDDMAMKRCLEALPADVKAYVESTRRRMQEAQEERARKMQQMQQEEEAGRGGVAQEGGEAESAAPPAAAAEPAEPVTAPPPPPPRPPREAQQGGSQRRRDKAPQHERPRRREEGGGGRGGEGGEGSGGRGRGGRRGGGGGKPKGGERKQDKQQGGSSPTAASQSGPNPPSVPPRQGRQDVKTSVMHAEQQR